ncbi:LamG-like jellyroll fold domain-containing protein [Micromonospora haikouensis]|uniref:LamG domain-containing protein n=1 Tax=Micromonospora haikouensis TaxID=686309 RepID=UPI003D7301F9
MPVTIPAARTPGIRVFAAGISIALLTAGGAAVLLAGTAVAATPGLRAPGCSAACAAALDLTLPAAPVVSQPTGTTMNVPATFTIARGATGDTPSSYVYQLNSGPPAVVTADVDGNATAVITPTRLTNTLTVTGVTAAGAYGESAHLTFNSAPGAPAADGDLTGDGVADLLTVGGVHGLPSGLWLAAGDTPGSALPATNIGALGNGTGDDTPAAFDGAQVITGRFTGNSVQDVLVYYPTGVNAGGASVVRGNGDGSVLQPHLSGNQFSVGPDQLLDPDGTQPLQLANAGDTRRIDAPYPDLIGISGSSGTGHHLTYYPNLGVPGGYLGAFHTTAATPTGGTDWNDWTIATAQLAGGTAMFLWHRASGALHLWTDLTVDPDTGVLSHTAYALSTSWNTGEDVTLHAADVDADGDADLWTVGANGATVRWRVSGLTAGTPGTGTLTADPARPLVTPTHSWQLNDADAGAVSTARDAVGALHATGTAGVGWRTGDVFTRAAEFDGTSGTLTTPTKAVATDRDFTVAAWVKPTVLGGTVISQSGTNTAGFRLYTRAGDSSWRFAMARSDSATARYDTVSAGADSARPGVWTHVTVNYRKSSKLMTIYVNGAYAGQARHHVVRHASGGLRIGSHQSAAGTYGGWFTGELAFVQTWNRAWSVAPGQVA